LCRYGLATIQLYRYRVHDSCLINGPGVPDSTTLKAGACATN
jgi:hypothetical protein